MQQTVITAVGPDRPGLVDELAGYLDEAGANIADSRMINLSGHFALIILADAPTETWKQLEPGFNEKAKALGLTLALTPRAQAPQPVREGLPLRLRTHAMDRAGIVHRISHLLASHGANIEQLDTSLQPGSYAGPALFSMDLRMVLPPEAKIGQVRRDLEALCDELNVEFELEAG